MLPSPSVFKALTLSKEIVIKVTDINAHAYLTSWSWGSDPGQPVQGWWSPRSCCKIYKTWTRWSALLIMELIFTLQSLAAEVAVDLVECTLYLFMLILARASVHFNHLAIVSTLALMCGTSKVISSLFCLWGAWSFPNRHAMHVPHRCLCYHKIDGVQLGANESFI